MHDGYSTIRVFQELKILTDQPLIFFGVFQEIYAFIISNRQAIRDSAGFTPSKISSNSSAVSVIVDVDS